MHTCVIVSHNHLIHCIIEVRITIRSWFTDLHRVDYMRNTENHTPIKGRMSRFINFIALLSHHETSRHMGPVQGKITGARALGFLIVVLKIPFRWLASIIIANKASVLRCLLR